MPGVFFSICHFNYNISKRYVIHVLVTWILDDLILFIHDQKIDIIRFELRSQLQKIG